MVVFLNFLRLLQSFNWLKISHLIEFIELLQGFVVMRGIFDPVVEGEREEMVGGCFLEFSKVVTEFIGLKISYLVKFIEFVQLFVVRECII